MFKALLIASVFFATTVVSSTPQQAEACGVKIGVGSAKGKRQTHISSRNPSKILVVGRKDQTLIRKLESARHKVEYASSVDAAKGSKYKLVIADASQVDAAKDRFAKATIVKRKDRGTAQMVELALARRNVTTQQRGNVIATKETRKPVETGAERVDTTGRNRAASGSETPAARVATTTTPVAAPTRVAVTEPKAEPKVVEPKVVEPKVVEPKVAKPKAEPKVVEPRVAKAEKSAKWSRTFQFGTNKTNLNAGAERRLRANALWLEQNPGASVTIEGHTDSVGDEAYNLDLSERRANVARDFLMGLGVDESRITVSPKGELEPEFEPSTSARNRRIVLIKN